jgi:hypothetical protein
LKRSTSACTSGEPARSVIGVVRGCTAIVRSPEATADRP